jgi:hypothetical protein
MARKREQGQALVRAGDLDFLKGRVEPAETPGVHPPVKPTEFQNHQLNLFQNFLHNREEERDHLSNAIDLWDSVPRYAVSRQAMNKSRENGAILKKHTTTVHYMRGTYECTITPARVTDLDGTERDYYPSANEELVEDALRKLASEQHSGFFDKPNLSSGVVFSLYGLREELAKRDHARSYQEARLSIDILSGSIIEIRGKNERGEEMYVKSSYLLSVIAVSKAKLEDDPKAKWAVQFHPLVTASIDKLAYRQFNYDKMMRHKSHLSRWLHKQLVLKCTGADLVKPFEMRYSTVKRDSGLLNRYTRERAAIEALAASLGELKDSDVIYRFERKDITGPRKKLLDVVFQIWPSFDFVSEVKAANKRLGDAKSVGLTGGSNRNSVGPGGRSR